MNAPSWREWYDPYGDVPVDDPLLVQDELFEVAYVNAMRLHQTTEAADIARQWCGWFCIQMRKWWNL